MKISLIFSILSQFFIFIICSNEWSANFLKEHYRITDQSWQISMSTQKSRFECLNTCRDNFYCAYVVYEGKKCILYSEFAKNSLVISANNQFLFEKIHQNIKHGCNASDQYWSLRKKRCLRCPNSFVKYSIWPFACYLEIPGTVTFPTAQLQCHSNDGFTISPKNKDEIDFVSTTFRTTPIWTESSISRVKEIFRWKDGMRVGGFKPGEPNNHGGSATNLVESAMALAYRQFNDYSPNSNRRIVCQTN